MAFHRVDFWVLKTTTQNVTTMAFITKPRTANTAAMPPSATAAAVTADGNSAAQTTKLLNSIQGENELVITFTKTAGSDASNVLIFPGIWAQGAAATLPEGVTMNIDGFADRNTFLAYFAHISTGVAGIRMEVSGDGGVNNYGGYLFFQEKDPSGEERNAKRYLSKYREPLATTAGYSETLEIPASDFSIIMWHGLRWGISKLIGGTTLTIYIPVKGWNKAQDLSALQAQIL